MKKMVFLLVLPLLLLACVNPNKQKLLIGNWRLQNPENLVCNSCFTFNQNGTFVDNYYFMNVPNSNQTDKGTYSCVDDKVDMTIGNTCLHFRIIWYSDNRFELDSGSQIFIFAQSGSVIDTYESNYQKEVIRAAQEKAAAAQAATFSYFSTPTQSGYVNNNPSNSEKLPKICSICHGVGDCPNCNGAGWYDNPYTGERMLCGTCNGGGKCWHCNGSGYEP